MPGARLFQRLAFRTERQNCLVFFLLESKWRFTVAAAPFPGAKQASGHPLSSPPHR